jgi:hypothetical protein
MRVIGEESIVGALCFVPTGMVVPARKIVVGNPARIVKDVTDEMAAWKSEGTKLYQGPSQRMPRNPHSPQHGRSALHGRHCRAQPLCRQTGLVARDLAEDR